MSKIKNVGQIWMALNTSKCNHLTPLRFKELSTYLTAYQCLIGSKIDVYIMSFMHLV